MSVQFKTEDVVKLMMQFLGEEGLLRTLKTLQEETQVSLNIVDNVDTFAEDIKEGRWDRVLNQVQKLRLPGSKLLDLYEIVVAELLELGESLAAQVIVKQALKPAGLYEEFKERALRLEYLSKKTPIDIRELYNDNLKKDKRRANLANSLLKEVVTAPPSRLLQLLGDALRHQESTGQITTGIKLDLFTGHVPQEHDTEDTATNKVEKVVQFGEESRILCAEFTQNGQSLALGSADGIIEIWDSVLMRMKSELGFQQDEQFMFHEESIYGLAFSADGEILASGDKSGLIKIWKVSTGKNLKKIETSLGDGISCMKFSTTDPSHLLIGSSSKNFIRVYGLKSSSIVQEYRVSGKDGGRINGIQAKGTEELLSFGSDGFLRVWNSKTGEQTLQCQLARTENQTANEVEIYNAEILKHKKGIFVCDRSHRLAILDATSFEITKEFINDRNDDFAASSISPQKTLIYGATNKGYLYCYRESDTKIQACFKLTEDEIVGLKHHPTRNIQILFTSNGDLLFIKPS